MVYLAYLFRFKHRAASAQTAPHGPQLLGASKELVKSIEDLREKREELNRQILKEELFEVDRMVTFVLDDMESFPTCFDRQVCFVSNVFFVELMFLRELL